jgi:hypothetical protein
MRAALTIFAGAILMWVALHPKRVFACTCAGGVTLLRPIDGATDVPRNTEIKVFGADLGFKLEREDGASVPVQVTRAGRTLPFIRLRPEQLLDADTGYVITGLNGPHSTFRTGQRLDETNPTLGAHRITERMAPAIVELSSCGPSQGVRLEVDEGSDEGTAASDLLYLVYLGRSEQDFSLAKPETVVAAGPSFLGQFMCNDTLPIVAEQSVQAVLRAVDLAGNESEAGETMQLSGCGCSSTGSSFPLAMLLLFGSRASKRYSWSGWTSRSTRRLPRRT